MTELHGGYGGSGALGRRTCLSTVVRCAATIVAGGGAVPFPTICSIPSAKYHSPAAVSAPSPALSRNQWPLLVPRGNCQPPFPSLSWWDVVSIEVTGHWKFAQMSDVPRVMWRTASEGPLMSASVPLLLSGLKFIALSPVHLPHQYGSKGGEYPTFRSFAPF